MLTLFRQRTLWEQQKDFKEARDDGMAVASAVLSLLTYIMSIKQLLFAL